MQRNRKRGELRVGTVAKTVIVCVLLAMAGLGYVWEKNHILRLGDEIRDRELQLSRLTKRTAMLQTHQAFLETPAQLELRLRQYNLALVAPQEKQVIRLVEPGSEWDQPVRRDGPTRVAATTPVQPQHRNHTVVRR